MPVILALGGGVCENTSLISLLQHTGSLIYLRAPEYTLYTRIRKGGIPPFLDPQQPKESFHELYEYRDACYRSCCDTILPLGDLIGIEEASVLLQQTMDSIHGDSHEQ
jgi:shikimate kinase